MSANTQTITAKFNGTWYCWVETAEECCGDDGVREISVFDKHGVFTGKTEREAISKAYEAFGGDIEYGHVRAVNGKAHLVKDGTPVFIKELRPPKKATHSKMEQVQTLEERVAELERKNKVLSAIVLDQKLAQHDLLEALREISESLDTAIISMSAHSLNLTDAEKEKALTEYFNLNETEHAIM